MMKTNAAATFFFVALIFALAPLALTQSTSPDLNAKLIEAARTGDNVAVQRLLNEGANIEARDKTGTTALFIASSYGRTEVVKLLLEKGAYVEVRNDYGTTPLIEATNKGYAIIVKLLLEKGANIENDEQGQKPLARAVLMNKYDIVKLLLEKGANIEARDNNGWTALIVAASVGRTELMRLLLEKGANIEARNKNGSTVLIMAAQSGIAAAVKLLLEKGANIEARDNFGKSALDRAQDYGRSEVVAFFEQVNPLAAKKSRLATASAAGSMDIEQLRSQAAIATAYNFHPVPPTAGKDITVAIIAEGIDSATKNSLGERVYTESVLAQDTNPFVDADIIALGARLAGLVGALAPQARIISIKALDSRGRGSFADLKNGINRATELKAKIIILSCSAKKEDADMAEAIQNSLHKGVLIVAPAGDSSDKYGSAFPGSLDGVVSIGASDIHDKVAEFSCYGGKIIFAPGSDITTIPQGKGESNNGASFAAAVAGGIFAVLWSQNPGLTRQELVSIVIDNASKIEDRNGGQARRIDAQAALNAIKRSR